MNPRSNLDRWLGFGWLGFKMLNRYGRSNLGVHPKSNGRGDLQRDRRRRTLPARWHHWRLTEASVSGAPRHGSARFLAQNVAADMEILTRCKLYLAWRWRRCAAVASSSRRLLPSSSDGVDGTYGCGTTSSPSSLASIVPKGSERSRTKTVRVWWVLVNCGWKLKQIRSIFIGLSVLSHRGLGDKLDSISKSNQTRKGKD
jgi:hypothetical protein